MTGDDSYHAHCFQCKVCHNRIDELVFAKTSHGIYCMNCHNERMAKIRRHAQRKREKEKATRDREARDPPPENAVSPPSYPLPSISLDPPPSFQIALKISPHLPLFALKHLHMLSVTLPPLKASRSLFARYYPLPPESPDRFHPSIRLLPLPIRPSPRQRKDSLNHNHTQRYPIRRNNPNLSS
jgi:hypothetical protein